MFKFTGKKGGHGRIYKTGEGEVTKIGDIGNDEVSCQQEAADLGISPKVRNHSQNSITMDEVIGETIWEKGELTEEQFQNLKTKIGKAHKSRLFHNDLVPQNVIIDEDGEAQIIDWGRGSTIFPNPECRNDEEQLRRIRKRYVK